MSLSLGRAAAAALALGLLALGLAQTAAALWYGSIERGLDLYAMNGEAERAAAREAAPALEALDARLGDPQALIDAAVLRLGLAEEHADAPARADVAAAGRDLESGLARLPASDLGWYELADARYRLADFAGARAALRTSMLLGYYDPALNAVRSWLGLRLWLLLDANEARMVEDQIRFAWLGDRDGLLLIARRDAGTASLIRRALDADARGDFDRALTGSR